MGYYKHITYGSYSFPCTEDGLIISPPRNQSDLLPSNFDTEFFSAIRFAVVLYAHIRPIIDLLNGGGTDLRTPADAKAFTKKLDVAQWLGLCKHIVNHEAQLPSDIVMFAQAMVERGTPPASFKQRKTRPTPRDKSGYVYILQSSTGHYKIGRTKNPNDRLRTFNVKLPFEVEFTLLYQTPDMYIVEQVLHDRFEHRRVAGEWFALTPQDIEDIKALEGGLPDDSPA